MAGKAWVKSFLPGAAMLMIAGQAWALPPHHAPNPPIISALQDAGPMAGAAAGLGRVYGGTPIDVLTYHYDAGRTGWNRSETGLTPASVGSAKFGLLKTLNVDGNFFCAAAPGVRFHDAGRDDA